MKKIQINPIFYIATSFLIGGIVSHLLFGGISESELEQKLEPYKKENTFLKKDLFDYKSKLFFSEKKVQYDYAVISTLKTDLTHSLIAAEYFFKFNSSWASSVINLDFKKAEYLENVGFASIEFLFDLKKSYGLDTLTLPDSSFQERLKPYLPKGYISSSK